MKTLRAFVMLSCVVVGCVAKGGPAPAPVPPKPTYTVLIDDAFVDDERASVASGADAWASLIGPDLTFEYTVAPRLEIETAYEKDTQQSTIYVMRVGTGTDIPPECLLLSYPVACYHDRRIWFAVYDLDSLKQWPQVSAHEFGHALGLAHEDSYPSIMRSQVADMATRPTDEDLFQYCVLHPCSPRTQRDH